MAGGGSNPWSGLKNQAKSGVFKIDPKVAPDAVQYIADAMTVFEIAAGDTKGPYPTSDAQGMKQYKDMLTVDHFGSLGSGKILSNAFATVASELINKKLPEYKKSLQDLGEAFVIAGQMVKKSEETSESVFNAIKAKTAPKISDAATQIMQRKYQGGAGGQYSWVDVDPDMPKADGSKYDGKPLEQHGPATEVVDPHLEPAESFTYYKATEMYWALVDKPNGLLSMGGDWTRMAARLESGFADLGSNIDLLVKDRWQGDGSKAAKGAVDKYVGASKQLTTDMRQIGQLLVDGAMWTINFRQTLPQPDAKTGQYAAITPEQESAATKTAQDGFRAWYRPGIQSSTVLPVLPPPTGIPGVDSRTTDGGDQRTSGGGGGGSSAADNAAAQQRAAQAAAQQQKALEQAQAQTKQQQAELEKQRQQAEQQAAQQQAQQAQQAAQQQAEQAAQQAASQAQDALKQGLDSAKSAAEQAAQQAQAAAAKDMQSAGLAGLPSALSALGKDALKAGGGAGAGKGAGGGAGSGAGAGLSPNSLSSKLFPRAAVGDAAAAATAARAGLASTGQPGSPGGMGPAGHGAGGQNKEHKRAAYLDSVEHIEEALGDAPVVVKPVVEQ
ncbi:WXG100 family type VII secretion target [Nocardia pseudovaccinii]|uniref:WXG100 family type VII secretion target n=1 Tax=Nocardia pseudovaccinii TaxID=189540 RepID=UPI003D8E1768